MWLTSMFLHMEEWPYLSGKMFEVVRIVDASSFAVGPPEWIQTRNDVSWYLKHGDECETFSMPR